MASNQHQVFESSLKSFFIYCPELGTKEGSEHLKILYYTPDDVPENRKVRNIGLCEALVNFAKVFSLDKPCDYVHTQKAKQVFLEPEPGIWMVLTAKVSYSETVNNSERGVEYHDNYLQESSLKAALKSSYSMFKLFNGTFRGLQESQGLESFKKRLSTFYGRYWSTIDISKLDLFTIFQGIQFLPLDKYMYLKVLSFVNLVETTFRHIKKSVFIGGDQQLVWSGLEPDDTKVFYQYVHTWLLKNVASPESSIINSQSSISSSVTSQSQGCFITGDGGDVSKPVWVYIHINQQLVPCRLYVYSIGNCYLCMFFQTDTQPTDDFMKRLGNVVQSRMQRLGGEIKEFVQKTRTSSQDKFIYKMVYFNEMNLAVKTSLATKKPSINPDMMYLLVQINAEYDKVEEGETVVRTLSDYWVVAKKNGHRRFFVLITQKDVNFAEVNEEVRKLCQREFSNIYFMDQ